MANVIVWFEDRTGQVAEAGLTAAEAADWLCRQCEDLEAWDEVEGLVGDGHADPSDGTQDPVSRLETLDALARGQSEATWGYTEVS